MRTDELELAAERDAAARARAFLRSALHTAPAEVAADAELVVTELVTNAQLHGLAPITVRATWAAPCVTIEVQDHGRRMPVIPSSSAEAMTGRGLSLVAAVCSRWGVRPAQEGPGKVVWAEVGGAALPAASDAGDALLAAWPDDEAAEPTFTVRLGSVPTDLLVEAKLHLEGVIRELTLERGGAGAEALVPDVQALVETITNDFADARNAIKQQAVEAAARGDQVTDLLLTLPASAADAGERYLEALTRIDVLARRARLLTLETPLVHRVFRHWYVQSLVDQLRARAGGGDVPAPTAFVRILVDEVTRLAELQETADRLTLLQRVNGDLTGARTLQDIAAVVVRHATESLGAQAAMVFVADGGVLRSVHAHGSDPRWAQRYQEVPLDADLPGAVVFNTGQPLLLRNLAQMTRRWPFLGQVYDSERVLHVVPLIVGDHRVGILSLSFPPGGRFDEDTQSRFVQALADALAQAMQRAQSMDQAAAAAERLAFLADASVALTASLDFERTVEAVTGLLVPRLADWCTLVLLEDDQLVTVGVAHTDPAKVRWARELVRAYPSRIDAPYGDGAVLRTGRSELHTDMPDELLVAAATDAEHLRLLREVGMRSGLAVPLPGRSGIIGVLTVLYGEESGRHYTEADVAYLEDVAGRAALALETAGVLRQQSGRLANVTQVAEATQQAILAKIVPHDSTATVADLSFAGRYVPAGAKGEPAAGDWYDVVDVGPDEIALIVGDVSGHGVSAVARMQVVRAAARAYALADAAPTTVLARLDAFVDRQESESLATVWYGLYRPSTGRLVYASAGHPPPVLWQDGGEVSLLTFADAPPLGTGVTHALATRHEIALRPGAVLCAYSDGLVERPDRDLQMQLKTLRDIVRRACAPSRAGTPESIADEIITALVPNPEQARDDVCLLLVRRQADVSA
jgi:serine phosphatase RsbU (regulator of sigma subunit)/anti-sigma regulatory factor (Ser/Thr protein kinase)